MIINKKSKIYVAGHKGLVGSAIVRKLKDEGFNKIITADIFTFHVKQLHHISPIQPLSV